MAEILEAGATPLDTISDHAPKFRELIDRLSATILIGDPELLARHLVNAEIDVASCRSRLAIDRTRGIPVEALAAAGKRRARSHGL